MEPIKLIPLHSGRAEVWSNGAENLSVHLTYDVSNYLKSWPDAQPSVAFERADGEKYPHAWELDGPVLHIPLLLADTEIAGMCKCMITLLSGDGRANTMVFYGSVTEGIDSLGEEPTEPMLGIIEQVNLAAADANAAKVGAENAQTAAEEAQRNAQDAATAAEDSENAAKISEENALQYAQQAGAQKDAAADEVAAAKAKAEAAANSATAAGNSAAAAASSASNAQQNAASANQAREDASTHATNAENSATAAQEALANMEERYYVPSVDTDGNLSFTPTSSEMTAVDTVNIRGPQGIQGPVGPTGPQGPVGGTGADGVSPIISIEDIAGGHRLTITDKDGTKTVDVLNGTQSDWNENDETSPAYVKGRTHWVEKETAVFFPETSFTADTLTDDGWPVASPVSNKPAAGTECTVTWNGTEYKCPVQELDSDGVMATIIGNGEVVGLTGNGEPFIVMFVPDDMAAAMGAYGAILPLDGSTSATITMAGESEVVHPLDPKYIGDLRGQKQITITIAEDGTVTSDTPFALAFALDERELNTAIRIVTSGHDVIAGQMVERQYSVVGVCKFDPGNGYGVINITYLPYVDLKDASGVKQGIVNMIWMKTPQGESGFDVSSVSSLPRCWNALPGETQYLEWSVGETVGDNNTPAGPGQWSAVTKENFLKSLGLSALNTDNAGKGLKVADDGTMAAEKYQQPEWGSETTIVDILTEKTFTEAEQTDGAWALLEPFNEMPVAGNTYTVNWNGTPYESQCQTYTLEGCTMLFIGDGVAAGGEEAGLTGNGEPFAMLVVPLDAVELMGGFYAQIVPLDGSVSVTLSIVGVGETVIPIDAKYIPVQENVIKLADYGFAQINRDGARHITNITPATYYALVEQVKKGGVCLDMSGLIIGLEDSDTWIYPTVHDTGGGLTLEALLLNGDYGTYLEFYHYYVKIGYNEIVCSVKNYHLSVATSDT